MNQTTVSPHLGHQSLDLRDVVKDSMYREARGLSVKTASKEDALIHNMKRRDSPRPPQLSNLVDGSYGVGTDENGNQRMPVDLRESYRVLAKLRETPWYYYGEARELPRPSNEVKDGHGYLMSKDAPRFSYDGRETSCLSFESRNAIKGPPKPKERPRLSLDSREGSWGTYSYDSKTNHLLRGLGSGTSTSDDKVSSLPQSLASQRRPPSVVAKLMGLETLPNSFLSADTQSSWSETPSVQYDGQFPRSTENGLIKPLKVFSSPKSSLKDPSSPRRKNPDLVMKPISSSRFPIEPAPWKQPDGNQNSQKSSSGAMKSPARTRYSFPSVYSEIEKRLKNLEFKQSGRDLRALQQILETMQEKGLLETKKEEQALNVVSQQNPQGNGSQLSSRGGADLEKTCESPIVIMKPTKLVEKNGNSSSIISLGRLSGVHKLDSGSKEDKKKAATSIRIVKDLSPKNNRRDASANHNDKKESSSKTARSSQSQPRSQQFSKESSSSSVKNSGSVRLRMQQKKLEFERGNPQYPPPDSNKTRRKSSKQVTDSGSPGGKQRPKSPNLQHHDDQQIQMRNESRASSSQGDEIFMQFDCVAVSNSNMDMEVSSSLQSADTNDSQSPSLKDIKRSISRLMQKKSIPRLDEDESFAELATSSQEHASPVSVLDASVYRDDQPSSVNQISNSHKDAAVDDAREYKGNEDEDPWNPVDKLIYNTRSREMNRKKLQSIDQLVQKLRRVNSSHDESRYDYIASLCENTSPDQRYISEILVASGLLLRDLSSELLTFQLHSSGHPINPELFFVLEQTKASSLLLKKECGSEKVAKLKLNAEKNHRKLIFDVVNEILSVKLALVGSSSEPWVKPSRITKKTLSAQKLLKELCFEIEKIQSKKKPECNLENEEDSLKSILREDVMYELESWMDFHGELSGAVLDVERMIFKDLINEIVIGESSCQRIIKPSRRKKLFGK